MFNHVDEEHEYRVKKWVLTILLELGGLKRFVSDGSLSSDDLADFLDLESLVDECGDVNKKQIRKHLLATRDSLKRPVDLVVHQPDLTCSIDKLGNRLGLSKVESQVFELFILVELYSVLEEAIDLLGDLTFSALTRAIARLLGCDQQAAKAAVSYRSLLARVGLLKIDKTRRSPFSRLYEFPNDELVQRLVEGVSRVEELFDSVISAPASPTLSLDDFLHLNPEVDTTLKYLESVYQGSINCGVNILLYGQPGTGKTELSRLFADEIGVKLYEVSTSDSDGDRLISNGRWDAYMAAQRLFSGQNAMIAFDEIEDIFDDGGFFQKSTVQGMKGLFNQMLEQSPVPTIWITNNQYVIDEAFIRRFDLVLHVGVPTRRQRHKIAAEVLDGMVSSHTIEQLASSEHLSPAIVQRATKVAKSMLSEQKSLDDTIIKLASQTLRAQGYKPISRNFRGIDQHYQLDLVNADTDLAQIAEGIQTAESARICLYGAAGTGKTEYAHWLADKLDKPILVKKGSDLLSKWVGDTEQRIARAFEEAQVDDAVLLLDEVDSFLQDKTGLQKSWQITQVNELLTQMETFNGVFIASTNLIATLDKASLRRFDLKVKFDYLTLKQRTQSLMQFCKSIEIELPTERHEKRIQNLDNLTIGDFTSLKRRSKFSPITSPMQVVAALTEESQLKSGVIHRRIGFH